MIPAFLDVYRDRRLRRTSDSRIETAAQLLHSRRHRLGYGQSCNRCRDDARAVAAVLADPAECVRPAPTQLLRTTSEETS